MACFHPIEAYRVENQDKLEFKKPKTYIEKLKVPCGKCIGCLLDKANDWATRCYCEAKCWENNCFITLTYDDEHLPKNAYLCKKDVQDFWKRLRYYEKGIESWENPKTKKTEKPIRYLLCGEYGEKNLRPHYHACVFNWKPDDLKFYKENHCGNRLFTSKKLKKIWGKGFVIIGDLNYQSACYVSRYVSKKLFKDKNRQNAIKLQIQPEFIDSSRNGGIGIKYWYEQKDKMIRNNGILIKIKDKVKNKSIPKFFMNKWKDSKDLEYDCFIYEKQKNGEKQWKEQLAKTDLSEQDYMTMLEKQLTEKGKTLKRSNII